MKDDIKAEGERFLADHAKADSAVRIALRPKGQKLALRLRSAAVDLSYDKATEFSPDIQPLFLLAAKIAYLTFGARARELEPFEREISYYAKLTPPSPIVAAYEAFKRTTS